MMSWQLGRSKLLQYNYVEYCHYSVSHDNQSNHYVQTTSTFFFLTQFGSLLCFVE